MAKRPAEEPLEEATTIASPSSKKARIEEEGLPPPPPAHSNGHSSKAQEMDVEDNESEDEGDRPATTRQDAPIEGYDSLYLDTIHRDRLDFDFEKLCSITLQNINVYACLVCGKYFAGRGPRTPAYLHALDVDHHVYINMGSKKVFVLPEGYEVKSRGLEDIKFQVDPRLSVEEVRSLDRPSERQPSWDLNGRKYTPGYVGLNNIKANDYLNVVIQGLSHVHPLRNFFMLEDLSNSPQLLQRLSVLVRKIWNPRAFKRHVSPHELMQEISLRSNKKFVLTDQADPVDFLNWFLNNVHLALGGSKTKSKSSIIQRIFQGRLRVESQKITARADAGDRLKFEDAATTIITTNFMILTLDLPPAPLFQDAVEAKNIIPQVPLTKVLEKYNGITGQEQRDTRVRYRLIHPLPPFLIMHVKRFQPNKFLDSQRNPTIVTFNPRSLDMSPYVEPDPAQYPPGDPIIYDLAANITHEGLKVRDDSVEGEAERKVWKAQVREAGGGGGPGRDNWWEIQDLDVKEVNGELLATKESYIMIWERRKVAASKGKATT
ncbi:cysteine proteinase [Polychaeton citri CBS 116435]|uniref:Cysteine proteinase n=1 Tax=Polychaeton citri CBS 116435 TaxID=1314669 RepID=A0A9P4QIL0_9PEZI|nr:cysteine proteinase [Polychaeton citri CBS 116435]